MTYDFSLARSVAENSGYRRGQKSIIRDERRLRIAELEQKQRVERDKELSEQLERLNTK